MKTTAIMCAYNEAPKIGFESYLNDSLKVLEGGLQTKLLDNAIFVDDGSTDNTYDFACNKLKRFEGFRIVKNYSNKGKAKAFLSGLRNCPKDTEAVITLDADMRDFKLSNLHFFKKGLEQGFDMVVGLYHQTSGRYMGVSSFSGLRAIKFEKICQLFNGQDLSCDVLSKYFDYNQAVDGYRLEEILECLIDPNKRKVFELEAKLRGAGNGNYPVLQIVEAVGKFQILMEK